ncbi:MAG: PRC-barrel domain-containing protein [Acidimicrobiia bacterium]|nr:PRC-barrel domain-containing protein [Acidimicrobiia bacterium]MBT8249528.1 PRC-barrel domain-containing protein [Acidimicrobiia bacterium]NNC42470.1 PRC-barrel domain-containing protein [Acidimicrobiia bacterium]NND12808.1 PRC-barrel domain-containing protein [Acidimicrobiia bacterium]NNL27701.1 PRC-barrel domain-containing protein [Acidimicrobiia bacterium]
MNRTTLSASSLVGNDVRNLDGDDLGDVKDLMIDVETGQVAYAVLDMGGFLGIGNKLFAVPYGAMTLDTGSHAFVVNVDKETLRNAPGFDQDNWPDFSDRTWGSDIYSHYGISPYWER